MSIEKGRDRKMKSHLSGARPLLPHMTCPSCHGSGSNVIGDGAVGDLAVVVCDHCHGKKEVPIDPVVANLVAALDAIMNIFPNLSKHGCPFDGDEPLVRCRMAVEAVINERWLPNQEGARLRELLQLEEDSV